MGLLSQEDERKGCRLGFQRQDLAGSWSELALPCGFILPGPPHFTVVWPISLQGPQVKVGPLSTWCNPTAIGRWAPASLPSPSQALLWSGLVFTKFLSSVIIPCGQGCFPDLPPLSPSFPHMASVASAHRPLSAVTGHLRNHGLRKVKTLAQQMSLTPSPGASLTPCQAYNSQVFHTHSAR